MTIILLKWFNFLFYTDIISYDREEVNIKYFNCLLKSNNLFFFQLHDGCDFLLFELIRGLWVYR